MKKSEFEKQVAEKFGPKFDLSKLPDPILMEKYADFVCPIHGEFRNRPSRFLQSEFGCRKCKGVNGRKTNEEFHKEIADLGILADHLSMDKFVYVDAKTKGTVTCKHHGDFLILPNKLKIGQGCPLCKSSKIREKLAFDIDYWVPKLEEVHGKGTYDYSKFVYVNNHTDGEVVCKKHGSFYKPMIELFNKKQGCPTCSKENYVAWNKGGYEEASTKVNSVHKGRIGMPSQEYSGRLYKHLFLCPTHGEFKASLGNVLNNKSGCPRCSHNISLAELEIIEFLEELGLEVSSQFTLPSRKKLDIYLPTLKLGIEYNGLYWHSDGKKKDKDYHLSKTLECKIAGIKLLHIFEDEWLFKKNIVKSRLLSATGLSPKIGARKTELKRILWREAEPFLESHHIQGAGQPSKVNYGLFKKEELVALLTVGPMRFSKESNALELLRYVSEGTVQGGFTKMLAQVKKDFPGVLLVTYADARWSQANVYLKAGFEMKGLSEPGYFWAKNQNRVNRIHMQKHKLKDLFPEIYSDDKSEDDICREAGFSKVYDCGHYRLELQM